MLILAILMCVDWIAYIYCLMLIELMLIVSIDELYWNWLNYMLLLRCVDFGMKLIMWLLCELLLRSGELKVIMNDLFWHLIDLCCCWDCGRWWVEKWDIEWCWWWKIELRYWDCGIEICWIEIKLMKNVNCLCLMVMSWLF